MHTDKIFFISLSELWSVLAFAARTLVRGRPLAKAAALAARPEFFKKVRLSIKDGDAAFLFVWGWRLIFRRLVSILLVSPKTGLDGKLVLHDR